MGKLTYDKSCRYCKLMDWVTIPIIEVASFIFALYYAATFGKAILLLLFIQPIIFISVWIVNRTLPMSHHFLMTDSERHG